MNYTLADLDKAIYYCLTLKKDKLVSYSDLYSDLYNYGLYDEYNKDQQLTQKQFENACEELTIQYDNVYHLNLKMKDYLIFTDKTFQDIEVLYGSEVSEKNKYNKLAINKNWLDKHDPYEQYDAVDTIIHAICRHADVALFDFVLSKHDIDFKAVNKKGQTVLELIPNTKDGFKIMRRIVQYTLDQNAFLTEDLYNKVKQIEFLTSDENYYKKEIKRLAKSIDVFKSGLMMVGLLWAGHLFVSNLNIW